MIVSQPRATGYRAANHPVQGSIKVQAIATPEHTPGSISYLVDDCLPFTDDTLMLRNGQNCPCLSLL